MKAFVAPLLRRSCVLAAALFAHSAFAGELGLFTDQADIGAVSRPGTGAFDAVRNTYTLGASGGNMWFTQDAMHYVWKEVSGDVSIAADISWLGESKQGHRKACLVIRQNLAPGSAYVDVAQHGDGLTSLQFRETENGPTREIQSMTVGPARVRLDKIGHTVYLSVAPAGASGPRPSGAAFAVPITGKFYVGLAVCAHDDNAFERATFSNVELGPADPKAAAPQPDLEIITLPSGDRRVRQK